MRKTKTRARLLQFLEGAKSALSAQEIHEHMEEINLATIYRNLSLFVSEGIIRELHIQKSETLYEFNSDGHEHAICSNCGEVKHVNIDKKAIIDQLHLANFDVDDIELNIKGQCVRPKK